MAIVPPGPTVTTPDPQNPRFLATRFLRLHIGKQWRATKNNQDWGGLL